MVKILSVVPLLLVVAACESTGSPPADDSGDTGTSNDDGGGGGGNGGGGNGGGGNGGGSDDPNPWTLRSHPCVGNRTDAMHWEGRDEVWVGCGTTVPGYGLFVSTDAGVSFDAPNTSPANTFDAFRVSSISRADDGLLYVAGINTVGSERVMSVDTSVSPMRVEVVFESRGQLWNSFHVGTYRQDSRGMGIAESLTSTELAYRTDDASPFVDGYGWWGGGESYQLLDLTLHDDRFYACGSTISQPPMVFLPGPNRDEPSFVAVQLSQSFAGEMWSIDAGPEGVITGGADQDHDVGFVAWSGPDPLDLSSWLTMDVGQISDEPTWIRGVCRAGTTLVAVGEYSTRGDGLVLISTDSGQLWNDETFSIASDLPAMHRCEVFPDGDIAIAGADGVIAIYDAR